MPYITIEVAQILINSQLKITLNEHNGSLLKYRYFIEAKEYGQWKKKHISYIKNFDIDKEIEIINRWSDDLISTLELKQQLKFLNRI